MPDETGTEATRSDAPSTDESLFGEPADDTAAPAADEQDANEESRTGRCMTPTSRLLETRTGSSEDLKVVVSLKGGRATIGVQQHLVGPAHRVVR